MVSVKSLIIVANPLSTGIMIQCEVITKALSDSIAAKSLPCTRREIRLACNSALTESDIPNRIQSIPFLIRPWKKQNKYPLISKVDVPGSNTLIWSIGLICRGRIILKSINPTLPCISWMKLLIILYQPLSYGIGFQMTDQLQWNITINPNDIQW